MLKSHLQSTRLQLSSFSIHFRAQIGLTKIMLKTLCQMSAPNPIKHCLDMAQVNTLATGCWLFWDVSFFLFMFCFLNHSVTNLKQMSKPLILIFIFYILDFCFVLFLDNPNSQCTTLNSSINFCLL